MRIRGGYHHVHLVSADPAAAASWYVRFLGAEIVSDADLRGARNIRLRVGEALLNIRDARAGENLAPPSGFPAISVPMGWVRDGALPTGLQFLGVMWSEGRLIGLAYAWEQATHHRKSPASTPRLGGG